MSQFLVSARKYRPQSFDDLVGQEHISKTLKNALLTDQLAHSFLFCGPRGVGKTTCARILAKVINQDDPAAFIRSGEKLDESQNFDFNLFELDAASNNSVEHMRMLIDQVRYPPQQGAFKVYIVDEVHMLSKAAFNAFLKTLEEPPAYAKFILATTEKHKIIPTILSRCQIFDFNRISVSKIKEQLITICNAEGIEFDDKALHLIAQKADGAMRDALSIFDRIVSFSNKAIKYADVIQNLNVLDYEYYFNLMDFLLSQDYERAFLLYNEIIQHGFSSDLFLEGFGSHIRDLLVARNESTREILEIPEDLIPQYAQQAEMISEGYLINALNIINEYSIKYKNSENKRLQVELAFIKLAYLNDALSLPKLSTQKKKVVLT